MNHGFVHDEEYSARRVIAGPYKVGQDGAVFIKEPEWKETLYYYRKPNNHVLHSVLARLCWTAWQAIAPPPSWHIKEWVIRIPAWVGGVGAVCTLALLLRRCVSPLAGVLAAWLLALHPWHLRFAAEARGYSLMVCTIPIVLYLWVRAIHENRWRWWLLHSASQFALVYCYPGSLYVLIVLNGATALWLLSNLAREGKSPALGRWFASNCFAAVAALQLMATIGSAVAEVYADRGGSRSDRPVLGIQHGNVFSGRRALVEERPGNFIISRADALCGRTSSVFCRNRGRHSWSHAGRLRSDVSATSAGGADRCCHLAGSWFVSDLLPPSSFSSGSSNGISFISCRGWSRE